MGGLGVTGDRPAPRNQGVVGGDCISSPSRSACVGAAAQAKGDVGLAVGDQRGQDVFDGGGS